MTTPNLEFNLNFKWMKGTKKMFIKLIESITCVCAKRGVVYRVALQLKIEALAR